MCLMGGFMKKIMLILMCSGFISACAPEVGSEKWCEKLKETPKGEWTQNETLDYAKHCLF